MFQREFYAKKLARLQPYVFAAGITLMSLGMSFAGSYGVPRRHADVEFTNAAVSAGFPSGAHAMLALVGIGASLGFLGLIIFVGLTVAAVFFGRSNAGRAMESWGEPRTLVTTDGTVHRAHVTKGTMVLALTLLGCFAIYYFANWKALADVWPVR